MKIKIGNCLDVLKKMPAKSIHTCVTSPPYWGLRDYGTATWVGGDPNCSHKRDSKKSDKTITGHKNFEEIGGVGDAIYKTICPKCGAVRQDKQLGLEETPQEYVDNLVEVFREVKRVLRDDGTLWLNLGDSYIGGGRGFEYCKDDSLQQKHIDAGVRYGKPTGKVTGFKPKDLVGIPWRVAFALQEDGWYLRQDIIWNKPNPMPESVKDRCTKSHEYIFLLSKSKNYYFDNEAIKEEIQDESAKRLLRGVSDNHKNSQGAPGQTPHTMNKPRKNIRKQFTSDMGGGGSSFKNHSGYKKADGTLMIDEKRNKRSVWTVTTKPCKEAHFATYPPDLIEPCILAGCPDKVCSVCGKPYERQTKIEKNLTLEDVKKIKENIATTNKIKKPYAVIDKEFRNQVIEYRNLPKHDTLRKYLKDSRINSKITIDAIEEHFGNQSPHHWFEKGGSYPSKEDWIVLKKLLSLDNTHDQAMTEVFYKSGLKGENNYIENGCTKQCDCETNETKRGVVLDPFGGAGTTALVADRLGRDAIIIELNKEYAKIAEKRLIGDNSLFANVTVEDG